jgi:hypothetical protein
MRAGNRGALHTSFRWLDDNGIVRHKKLAMVTTVVGHLQPIRAYARRLPFI